MNDLEKFKKRLEFVEGKREESAERIKMRGQTLFTCSDVERDIWREYNHRANEIIEFSRYFGLYEELTKGE